MKTRTPTHRAAAMPRRATPPAAGVAARLAAALSLSAGALAAPASAAELVTLATRSGVTDSVFVNAPAAAPAWVVVLFAGDDGSVALSEAGPARLQGNFVVRSAPYWPAHGEAYAIVDAPSDNADGMRDTFRLSAEASLDIEKIVAALRGRYPAAKIALLGTSRGTVTVGNVLKRHPELADAFVLTSPVTQANRSQPGLSGLGWEGNKARVLVVSNEHDGCEVSPFDSAKQLAARNGFDFIAVSSSQGGGNRQADCKAQSPHGFLGIEQRVLDDIDAWLDGRPAPAR